LENIKRTQEVILVFQSAASFSCFFPISRSGSVSQTSHTNTEASKPDKIQHEELEDYVVKKSLYNL
jgi:hypothetical protein